MKILLTGQCTLHIGRMEFGNIGNFYILEPLIRELHKNFPDATICTTFQLSDDFCEKENVTCLPMSLYYSWSDADLPTAELEYGIARTFSETGELIARTPYIDEVFSSDLVIDFSGDIWGDNANFLGENRFLVGLYKDRVAQLLGKKTVMLAGSPGPFGSGATTQFAREVFTNFALVTNREPLSRGILNSLDFDTSKLVDLACPAFLFEPISGQERDSLLDRVGLRDCKRPVVGVVICGWNFRAGPFDRWPRNDDEYEPFVASLGRFISQHDVEICLFSHSNGFELPAPPFKMIRGRDYPVIKQLHDIMVNKGFGERIRTLDGIYDAWQTKTIVGAFDMLISGRVHAAVAGLSQAVPTTMIDYGHEPKAHKIRGFARVAGVEDYVADPSEPADLEEKINRCWTNRSQLRQKLQTTIPRVKSDAKKHFSLLKTLV